MFEAANDGAMNGATGALFWLINKPEHNGDNIAAKGVQYHLGINDSVRNAFVWKTALRTDDRDINNFSIFDTDISFVQ